MRPFLAIEFLFLFVALPVAFIPRPLVFPPMLALWLGALYAWTVLRRDPKLKASLWRGRALRRYWRPVLALYLPVAALMIGAVWWFARDSLFVLPRERPALWCLILVLYPVASVAPQAILYRAFLLHRYGPLAGSNRAGIVVSAAAFAWMHVLFGNVLAPLLTLPAGLLFAWRYVRTGSLAVSVLEHTLYGCTIFTVGLGTFFHAR